MVKKGNLVDVYLSDVRDQAAAEAFLGKHKVPLKLHQNKLQPIKSRHSIRPLKIYSASTLNIVIRST